MSNSQLVKSSSRSLRSAQERALAAAEVRDESQISSLLHKGAKTTKHCMAIEINKDFTSKA
jgi:hypothetical protein